MKITYNVTGPARKELVNAIAHLLAVASVYQGPPSFAYNIGGYVVDKNGNLNTPEEAETDDVFRLVDALYAEYEYKPEEPLSELFPDEEADPDEADDAPENAPLAADTTDSEGDTEEADEALENGDSAPDEGEETAEANDAEDTSDAAEATEEPSEPDDESADDTHLTLSLPREKFSDAAIDRLRALVSSKQSLLKKVFETDDLSIAVTDDQIQFPWFTLQGVDGEIDAYAKFIHAIALRALTSSRISATEKPTDNDKFTMRLFLNNLGFKGEEYKFARRFLIRNLEGNGAWRYGNAPDTSNFDLEMPTVFKPTVTPPAQDEQTEAEAVTETGAESDPEQEEVENGEEESADEE